MATITLAPSQEWLDAVGQTPSGAVATAQALRDLSSDTVSLLVASHPDDRYILPALWLRYGLGHRIEVLLATRGGGGQNSLGPETGDSLERIRTLETEAGCSRFGGRVWYLNRPDGGFRRTAEEAFAEWGREASIAALRHALDRIDPDFVISTHHREEAHGHDLALVELLEQVVAGDGTGASKDPGGRRKGITSLLLGAPDTNAPGLLQVDVELLEPTHGATLRHLAYSILSEAHRSPGAPAPIDLVFERKLFLEPRFPEGVGGAWRLPTSPSLFDRGLWPGTEEARGRLQKALLEEIPAAVTRGSTALDLIAATLEELRRVASDCPSTLDAKPHPAMPRLRRRIEALEHLALLVAGVRLEVQAAPGQAAIAGEDFQAVVDVQMRQPTRLSLRANGLDGVDVAMQLASSADAIHKSLQGGLTIRMPLRSAPGSDPMAERFLANRFVPPVRIQFHVTVHGIEVPAVVTVPVEERPPLDLTVFPRMLLLPSGRDNLQFSVGVTRNSRFPIESVVEARAPAGYVIARDSQPVSLTHRRADLFGFEVAAPAERRAGVDVVRVRVGDVRVALPVHKVDVRTRPGLQVGLLRNRDDTLPNVLGFGGLGIDWSELSDIDVAVADLDRFDTIAVDTRALRDRPESRRGFRRLLGFANRRGKRLVVFYHKDTEFHPAGEGFVGAPIEPFQVGKQRVTRPDAPVRVLRPEHPLLRFPNIVLPGDWDGWDQERALYLPRDYSPQYEEILAMQDPGQPLEKGALLYARVGDGEYVYCALALWRQLKKLHPGAIRLFANLMTPVLRQ